MRWLGSVDILATTMRIRDRRFSEIVVCFRGRRCDGRSLTPAVCPHSPASLLGGAYSLPKPFRQTPIHSAAVAGRPLPDALRGLDLSRSRSTARQASRTAPNAVAFQRPRFRDASWPCRPPTKRLRNERRVFSVQDAQQKNDSTDSSANEPDCANPRPAPIFLQPMQAELFPAIPRVNTNLVTTSESSGCQILIPGVA